MRRWLVNVWEGFYGVLVGMQITWRHLFTNSTTLQYPEEKWELPPRSRMRLFMKYEDCIGCGQCARVCPVDCIHIVTQKRDKEAQPIFAANGQPIKLDVKVFDIDMSLCCYCNLCTYPCPTECIYMTTEYEFATGDLGDHLYHFAKPDAKFLTEKPAPKPPPDGGAAGGARPPDGGAAGGARKPEPPRPKAEAPKAPSGGQEAEGARETKPDSGSSGGPAPAPAGA